jgi:hypothetical protein
MLTKIPGSFAEYAPGKLTVVPVFVPEPETLICAHPYITVSLFPTTKKTQHTI